jgi:GT2 family glycosyltransferase
VSTQTAQAPKLADPKKSAFFIWIYPQIILSLSQKLTMAIIGMAVYSTEQNGKDQYLAKTLKSLFKTVDFTKHRLMLSVNAKTPQTDHLIKTYSDIISKVIYNETNLGTAEAINLIWRHRLPGENAVKMDDDITTTHVGWLDELEEVIRRDSTIGQIGLKRKDCIESPDRNEGDFYKSTLKMLPHQGGEPWIIVEQVNHVMGSCVLHSAALLEKVGYLYQMPGNKYGFDDALMSVRSQISGFKNAFLPHIRIDHIDPGGTIYQQWKEKNAMERMAEYNNTKNAYFRGIRSVYYNPFA